MQRLVALLALVALTACGGGSPSSPTPTPVPTPTPAPVSYAGNYSSNTLTFTDESGTYLATASVTVVEAGSTLVFGPLAMTTPFAANYPLGAAPHTNGRFDGAGGYNSIGCGRATTHYVGYYSADGGILNLTLTLNFSGSCGTTDIRGELRR